MAWHASSIQYDNDFSGSIPSDINSLTLLRDFRVQDSFMSGTIPTQLGQCQHLGMWTLSAESPEPDEPMYLFIDTNFASDL